MKLLWIRKSEYLYTFHKKKGFKHLNVQHVREWNDVKNSFLSVYCVVREYIVQFETYPTYSDQNMT